MCVFIYYNNIIEYLKLWCKNQFSIKSKTLLKLLNKCKFSVSHDETRHYLSGIFFHQTQIEDKNFLTAVSTDSHRMSISKVRLNEKIDFEPIILPKKNSAKISPLVVKASAGTLFKIPIYFCNTLSDVLKDIKDIAYNLYCVKR